MGLRRLFLIAIVAVVVALVARAKAAPGDPSAAATIQQTA